LRRKTKDDNDVLFDTYSIEEIIESYIKQADTVSKAIEAYVEYSVKEKIDCIIEGYHITPELIARMRERELSVRSIILVNINSEEIIKRCISSTVDADWVRDNTK